MGFRLQPDEYFRGVIREPDGVGREVLVIERATRAAVVNRTVMAADKRNWDWVIELCRDNKDEDNTVTTLGHWSSVQGDLPPASRREVPGLIKE